MTTPNTPAAPVAPVEAKVQASAAWTYLLALAGLAVVNGVSDTTLLTDLPDVLEIFVAPLVPAAAAGIGGYLARHTPRPDLGRS